MPDNNDNSSSSSYQSVLNKYSSKTSSTPPSSPQNPTPSPLPSPPTQKTSSLPPLAKPTSFPPKSPLPPIPPAKPSPPLPPTSPPTVKPPILPKKPIPATSTPPAKNEPDIFKYIFFFSLFIFLIVTGAITLTLIKSQQTSGLSPQLKASPSGSNIPVPTAPSASVCRLNDLEYQVGQSFPAADNCNICTCQPDLIISCTEKDCDQ